MSSRRYPEFPIPGVGGVVFGTKGVLLVRRDKEPGKGLWSIPGGGVEVGETQQEALVREVLEETGVRCNVLQFISTADIIFRDKNGDIEYHYILNHYLAEALSSSIRPETPDAEVGWFALDQLPISDMPEAIIDIVNKASAIQNPMQKGIRET
ncbi:MAG: NUDIX hydrolase [Candidatus Thorarchaeota archaeon]